MLHFQSVPANWSWTQIIWPKRITQQSNQAWTDTLSFPFIFDGVKLSLISSPFIWKVWQTIVETWRYIPSHLRYDLGGTRSRDVLALLISGRSIDKTNKHGGMSNISGTISESQICSIKLGKMDLIFSSHIPEVKASVNWIICIKFWQWCAF